ncbi:MAG: hypothetical protein ABFR75_09235 [Acidobacteriota bacterium]
MKIKILPVILFVILILGITKPVGSNTGIGFILGEPTGMSLRIDKFPVLGIAWSLDNYFHLHCDYWIKSRRLKRSVYWFWGFGGKMTLYKYNDKNFTLGMRVPIGLRYFPARRIEIFCEIVPGMRIYPSTAIDFDLGIGMRFIL